MAHAEQARLTDVLISSPEAGTLYAFSQEQYYLLHGGTPPSKVELAQAPQQYFRHAAAYEVFKRGFAAHLGQSTISDNRLQRLLRGGRTRLIACDGTIVTTGVTRNGDVSWFARSCAQNEQLLQLRVDGQWVTVASMGCLNLVDDEILKRPPPPVVMTGCDDDCSPEPPCTGDCNPEPPCTGDCNPEPPCTGDCGPVQTGQNPGNGKPVGNSRFDGITGNSHRNDAGSGSPRASPMDGQRNDQGAQPGGGNGPSSTGRSGGNAGKSSEAPGHNK